MYMLFNCPVSKKKEERIGGDQRYARKKGMLLSFFLQKAQLKQSRCNQGLRGLLSQGLAPGAEHRTGCSMLRARIRKSGCAERLSHLFLSFSFPFLSISLSLLFFSFLCASSFPFSLPRAQAQGSIQLKRQFRAMCFPRFFYTYGLSGNHCTMYTGRTMIS